MDSPQAAAITAAATSATQHTARVLEGLVPPVRWTRPVMAVWLRGTGWVRRYPSRGAQWYEPGHSASVTCVTHRTLPSAGLTPRATPLLGRKVCQPGGRHQDRGPADCQEITTKIPHFYHQSIMLPRRWRRTLPLLVAPARHGSPRRWIQRRVDGASARLSEARAGNPRGPRLGARAVQREQRPAPSRPALHEARVWQGPESP